MYAYNMVYNVTLASFIVLIYMIAFLYHPLYYETCNIYLHFYLKLPSHYLQVFTWAKLDCTGDTWLLWGWQCFHFCTYFRILIKNGMKYHRQEIDYKTYNTLPFKPSFANTLWIGGIFIYLSYIHTLKNIFCQKLIAAFLCS